MTATEITLLTIMPALLAASAFFSGSETALFGLTEHERSTLAGRSPLGARAAEALIAAPRRLLITILLGNMVVNVLFFVMASVLTLHAKTPAAGAVFAVAPLLAIVLLGEVTPKLIAASSRTRWCTIFAPAMLAVHRLITPIRVVIDALIVEPASRLAAAREPDPLTPDELGELLELSARAGAIDPREAELLDDVLELGTLRVREIMIPRVDILWVGPDADRDDIARLWRDTGVQRIVVADGSLDRGVLGVIDLPEALARLAENPGADARQLMDPPLYVPESARLDNLLEHFRGRKRLVAIVVDEFGAVDGLVTFHDVADRLGRLAMTDAGEHNASGVRIERLGPAAWRVPGRMSVHDFAEALGLDTGARAGSVAGLILSHLGRIARPGDRVRLAGVTLEVESVRDRAIDNVLVSLSPGGRAE